MDTTKQSAMNATNQPKSNQTERESKKTTISDSSRNLEHKQTSSQKVMKCEMLDNTPFMIIETEDAAYLAIGKYRMDRVFSCKDEVLGFLGIDEINKERSVNWEAITFVLSVIKSEIEEYINQRERSLK